jgi:aldehyde:ferredoxin oxidoreductase
MLCNRLGLDTISTGNVLAWAMECSEKGLFTRERFDDAPLSFGDHAALCSAIGKIARRKGIGDILALGSVKAARILGGEAYLVHSKGLDYPAVDVRGTKGMALSFAVSPRGGDHLKGLSLYEVAPDLYAKDIEALTGIKVTERFWLRYENKAELMIWHEDWHCVVDSLGICKLEGIALKPLLPRHFRDLLAAATGIDISVPELQKIGARIWNLERMFNIREGLGRRDDIPPARLLDEPISTGPSRGETLDRKMFHELLEKYYALRGWDVATGIPTEQTLHELGLNQCGLCPQ